MAKLGVVLTLFLAALISGTSAQCSTSCPVTWLGYDNHCYKFFDVSVTWQEARDECQSFSCATESSVSELVSIHSAGEQEFVYNYWREVANDNTRLWIGLTDQDTEGTFAWTDGSANDYQNFRSGEPNNGDAGEDHCHLYSETGLWNDTEDYKQFKYMCKITYA